MGQKKMFKLNLRDKILHRLLLEREDFFASFHYDGKETKGTMSPDGGREH